MMGYFGQNKDTIIFKPITFHEFRNTNDAVHLKIKL